MRKVHFPIAKGEMVIFPLRVMQVYVQKPVGVGAEKGQVNIAGGMAVADIQGKAEAGAFQQKFYGFLLKGGKAGGVFDRHQNSILADGPLAQGTEFPQAIQYMLGIFLKKINLSPGQCEINTLGKMHVDQRRANFLGKGNGFRRRLKIGVPYRAVKIGDVEVFVQMNGDVELITLRYHTTDGETTKNGLPSLEGRR